MIIKERSHPEDFQYKIFIIGKPEQVGQEVPLKEVIETVIDTAEMYQNVLLDEHIEGMFRFICTQAHEAGLRFHYVDEDFWKK